MKDLICEIYFDYQGTNSKKVNDELLDNLGFIPKIYRYIEGDESSEEVPFTGEEVQDLLNSNFDSITIQNIPYENIGADRLNWCKIENNKPYKLLSIKWKCDSLGFLVNNAFFDKLLKDENLICSYCYNFEDVFNQTSRVLFAKNKEIDSSINKNDLNDSSLKNTDKWGAQIHIAGLNFMVAPLMWLGRKYFDIIAKEKLMQFKYSQEDGHDLVKIVLFELNEFPVSAASREKQKLFWEEFNFRKIVRAYGEKRDKELGVDFSSLLENYLTQKKKKR